MTDLRYLVPGAVATLVGVALFASPALAFQFPVDPALLLFAGAAGGLLGLVSLSTRLRVNRRRESLPDPGEGPRAPGDDVSDALTAIEQGQHAETGAERETVYDRLTNAAIRLLEYRRGLDADEAKRLLGTGEWTDDPEAAAFFRVGPEDEGATFLERVQDSFTNDSRFARRARRAAAELDALAEEEYR